MAGIETGGGGGKRRAVDMEIPLIPFIDLLLCCVMFLLVTAVWNQLASIEANQQVPGSDSEDAEPEDLERVRLILQVQNVGYVLASTAGERIPIAKVAEQYDIEGLRSRLQEWRQLYTDRQDIVVAPEDGVLYQDVVRAMDIAVGSGFPDLSLSDAAAML